MNRDLPELPIEVQNACARQLSQLGPATILRSMAIIRLTVGHLILLGADAGAVRTFVEASIALAEARIAAARRRRTLKIVPRGES